MTLATLIRLSERVSVQEYKSLEESHLELEEDGHECDRDVSEGGNEDGKEDAVLKNQQSWIHEGHSASPQSVDKVGESIISVPPDFTSMRSFPLSYNFVS